MAAKTDKRPAPDLGSEEIVEVVDERSPLAADALALIEKSFAPQDRQPVEQIAMELAEKRMGLLTSYDFHLFVARSEKGETLGVSVGVFLGGGVNAGFITYLAVGPEHRGNRLGRRMRVRLVEAFRADARKMGLEDVAWVVGEVRQESPWLQRLVRDRAVIPFDLSYYHPGIEPDGGDERWVLYRQPVGDRREKLPAAEVRQLVYAIWRRAYRVRWPLMREGFRQMLAELEARSMIGAHPGVGS